MPTSIKSFLAQFALTHPMLRDMRQGRAFDSSGKLFVVTEGTVAFQIEGDALSRRLSIAMATTEHRGYLLTWFFAAPHESELRELMEAKMTLDMEGAPNRAKPEEAVNGGGTPAPAGMPVAAPANGLGGAAAPAVVVRTSGDTPAGAGTPTAQASATPSPAPSSPPSSSPAQNSAPVPDTPSASSGDPTPDAQASAPPSLLRSGESMNDQQMNGAPVGKKH